jgi:hypothetical protein
VDFETLYGSIHFDKFGKNVTKEMVFLQLQSGRFRVVWSNAAVLQKQCILYRIGIIAEYYVSQKKILYCTCFRLPVIK